MRGTNYYPHSIADFLRIVAIVSVASIAFDGLPGTAQAAIFSESNIAAGPASPSPTSLIPQQIRYSGAAPERSGDTVEAVFRIYATRDGGEPLWSETQRVTITPDGRYSVLLGSASEPGLPQTVFAAGQARWLGVSIERGEEQPRTLLASVAYAMKAADAETLAGRALSEFVTQEQLSATSKALAAQATALALPEATLSGSGTTGYVPLWTHSSALGDSILFQAGTTKVGIATKTPVTTLDVDGATTLRGTVSLPSAGKTTNSPMLELSASVSGVAQNFAWRAAATPSANLELLFGSGGTAPAATGLAISPKGIVTFAKGQTFPGTGAGTITGVVAGTALTGGGTTGHVTLNVDTTRVPLLASANIFSGSNTFSSPVTFAAGQTFPGTGNGTITGVTAGTALTGGGTTGAVTLNVDTTKVVTAVNAGTGLTGGGTGGAQTLTVDPTKVPLLASANTFAGSNKFSSPITFASGQTFPGAGTITGVTAGTALTGGGTTGTVKLNVDTTKVVTAVNAGAGLTGGGTGGAQTLNVDPTKVPLLAAANTFAGSNKFSSPITFAAGQTFPGTGAGTITGVTAGTGLTGGGTTGAITLNVDSTKVPLLAAANTFSGSQTIDGVLTATSSTSGVLGISNATAGQEYGVGGLSSSTNGYGVWGENPSTGGVAVYGLAGGTAGYGVLGSGNVGVEGGGNCCGGGITGGGVGVTGSGLIGIEGATNGPGNATPEVGWGVAGHIVSGSGDFSAEGTAYAAGSAAGVWGDDSGGGNGAGVLATADTKSALIAVNNTTSTNSATLKIFNYTADTHDALFETYSPNTYTTAPRNCVIDTSANLECSGLVEGQVTPDVDGKVRAMYAMQSPEIWFEDFGSSTLHSGSAHVSLEPIFGGTVNSGVEYHVFLTPKGECEGLYVANEGPEGFDVRELRHGKSSVGFDYRIVAKRKGYETVRMEDQTAQAEARRASEEENARQMAEAAAHPSAASPRRMLRARPAAPPALTRQGLVSPQ
jgi:hypothetical protein